MKTDTIKYVNKGAAGIPVRGSNGAAGWDLLAAEDTTLMAYVPCRISTNLDIELPEGTALLVMPRGGNALKKNLIIPNSPGLIDEDYRGSLGVIVTYIPHPETTYKWNSYHKNLHTSSSLYEVKKGDRIAQAVLIDYIKQEWREVDELSATERGRGAFGSTGESGAPDTAHSSSDTKV